MATQEGGANSKHGEVTIQLPELGSNDVQLEILACGLCHSDIALARNHWGMSAYPNQVSGHEIVGRVVAVGSGVKHVQMGQRCGVGWYRSSCAHCKSCNTGEEQLCAAGVPTAGAGNKGGFAEGIVVDSDYCFPLPEDLPTEVAAPLFCGGITIYSPLSNYGCSAKNVGIVGVGGIGSMGIQFAKALGASKVFAFSTSAAKEADAKELGADVFVNTKEEGALAKLDSQLDLIIVTVNVQLDWSAYLSCLRPKGALVFIGAVPGNISFPVFGPFLLRQLTVAASVTGGRPKIRDMLDFCANRKVFPKVEIFHMHQVDEAMEKVEKAQIRYRAVLKWNM